MSACRLAALIVALLGAACVRVVPPEALFSSAQCAFTVPRGSHQVNASVEKLRVCIDAYAIGEEVELAVSSQGPCEAVSARIHLGSEVLDLKESPRILRVARSRFAPATFGAEVADGCGHSVMRFVTEVY